MLSSLRAPWVAMLVRIVFVLLLVAVTVLSLMPDPEEVPGGMNFSRWLSGLLFGTEEYGDKVSHFIAYGVLGAVGTMAARKTHHLTWLALPLGLLAYSGLIELAQGLGGERQADWADLMANGLGLAMGMAGGFVLVWTLRKLADREAS